jgi:hypothetical protein
VKSHPARRASILGLEEPGASGFPRHWYYVSPRTKGAFGKRLFSSAKPKGGVCLSLRRTNGIENLSFFVLRAPKAPLASDPSILRSQKDTKKQQFLRKGVVRILSWHCLIILVAFLCQYLGKFHLGFRAFRSLRKRPVGPKQSLQGGLSPTSLRAPKVPARRAHTRGESQPVFA